MKAICSPLCLRINMVGDGVPPCPAAVVRRTSMFALQTKEWRTLAVRRVSWKGFKFFFVLISPQSETGD